MFRIGNEEFSEGFVIEAIKNAKKQGLSADIKKAGQEILYLINKTPRGTIMAYPSYEGDQYPGIAIDLEIEDGDIIGLSTTEVDTEQNNVLRAFLFEDMNQDDYTHEIIYHE